MRKLNYILLVAAMAFATQAHVSAKETKAGYGICDSSPGVAYVAESYSTDLTAAPLTPLIAVAEYNEPIFIETVKDPTPRARNSTGAVNSKAFVTLKVNRCKNTK